MKKRVAFALTVAFLLALPGCVQREKEAATPSAVPLEAVTPAPTAAPAEPTPPAEAVTLTYDPALLEPWQAAYIRLLEDEMAAGREEFSRDEPYCTKKAHEGPRYTLYDIDKDGTPELFVRYGYCEAAYYCELYTYRDGAVKMLTDPNSEEPEIPMGHSSLYSWPKGNGVVRYGGSYGYYQMDLLRIEGEGIKWERLEEIESTRAPEMKDYYPECAYLNDYYALVTAPEWGIRFLPILNYAGVKPTELSAQQAEEAEKLVEEVLTGDRLLFGVSGDGFGNDAGWVTLEEYCKPDVAVQYIENDLRVNDTQWQDLNGDGAREAILTFDQDYMTVLSAQEGIVYGYLLNYTGAYALDEDGVFRNRYREELSYNDFQVVFRQNQCYQEVTPTLTVTPTPTPSSAPSPAPTAEDIFPRSFVFCGGAGGWATELDVAADGSFSGYYQDMDMGGDPPTTYFCNFTGQFSTPEKVNEYTYSVRLEKLLKEDIEEKLDAQGMLWVPSIAYGLEGGDEFLIYLPGAPVAELPEYFFNWAGRGYEVWDDQTLFDYGLYNVAEKQGFSS